MRGAMIVCLGLLASGCGADERRSEGRATQADIDNSSERTATLPAPSSPSPSPTPTPSATGSTAAAAPTTADYLGRWRGVEGLNLVVTERPEGGVMLDMQYSIDDKGMFPGSVTAEGIRFIRNGQPETLVRTDGDATGLKWLAGKSDCLTVKTGEGYCRD